MRRTPLKRKTPLKANAGLKRGTKKLAARSKTKKDPRYRNRAYLNWVKKQPCVMCGQQADDPHHIIGIGYLGGAGTKAPDQYVMPVCRIHHEEIHHRPELWPMQWEWIARTLARAIEEGAL